MTRTITIAPVRRTIVVAATPEHAFQVFTDGIDRWWPKTHRLGGIPITESIIEPFVGGRWFTRRADGTDVTVGHVRAWDPGQRFIVGWEISADWKPEPRVALSSEVEVRFIAEGAKSTRIDLEHRDFERMGEADGTTMRTQVDGGWPTLLNLFASEISGNTAS